MSARSTWHNLLKNDFLVAACLLIIFLLTNGYTIGWDDQHLEIPLLKSLIDPGLYAGDYYVESLQENFASLLYPVLARTISTEMIPAVYFLLYLVSRFFLFYWFFKLWAFLSKDRLIGFYSALTFIVVGRVEEFLYRTFSHQELALAIIFAGVYFFYRERFVLASALLGLAANVHALYSLFPFFYLCVYLLIWHRTKKIKTLLSSVGTFTVCSLPILIWIVRRALLSEGGGSPPPLTEWTLLYKIACPQNFLFYTETLTSLCSSFSIFVERTLAYWFLIILWGIHFFFNPTFRKDKKSQSVILGGVLMLLVSFVFTYIAPNRFILDLNLIRNTQFMLFVLIGYLPILIIGSSQRKPIFLAVVITVLYTLLRFGSMIGVLAMLATVPLLIIQRISQRESLRPRDIGTISTLGILFTAVASTIIFLFLKSGFALHAKWSLGLAITLIVAVFFLWKYWGSKSWNTHLGKGLLLIPLLLYTANYSYYHYRRREIEKHAGGFWQLQRNWIDMQEFVKENTPVDALILVPHDMEMGGFRIFSEREIVCSYRDCGIIGFDYAAAKNWEKRLSDIEAYQVYIRGSVSSALINAILRYKVNYIVFMAYFTPGDNPILTERYRNEVFSLYEVTSNPVQPAP